MNGLDVGAAIIAVSTAFHAGADSMREIKKRRPRKKKGEQVAMEKLVLDTLETAESQISSRYAAHLEELGQQFQFGDDAARDTLLHIAVTMQTELVRSLQIARDHENAVLDLMRLHEDSIVYKRNTLNVLDELRQRMAQMPAPSYLDFGQFHDRSQKEYHMGGGYVQDVKPDVPMVVIPEPDKIAPRRSLGRLFSMKKHHSISRKPSISSTNSRLSLMAPFEWLGPAIQKVEEESPTPSNRIDEVDEPSGPPPEPKKPPPPTPPPAQQQDSNYLHVADQESYSSLSDYSDKILVSTDMAGDGYQSNFSPSPSSAGCSFSPAFSLDSSTKTPFISLSNYSSPTNSALLPDGAASFRMSRHTRGNSLSTNNSSELASGSLSPIHAPSSTVLGRPSKNNNYWGFCKGAWTIREDPRKGLSVASKPQGMYNRIDMWQCRDCSFAGHLFGKKKPFVFDTLVRFAAENGIRYRWMFLAKSHVKRKGRDEGMDCYGCVFCVDEGNQTGVFGDIGSLMGHIWMEHRGMRAEVARRNNCAIGHVQDGDDWDIHIPDSGSILDY